MMIPGCLAQDGELTTSSSSLPTYSLFRTRKDQFEVLHRKSDFSMPSHC